MAVRERLTMLACAVFYGVGVFCLLLVFIIGLPLAVVKLRFLDHVIDTLDRVLLRWQTLFGCYWLDFMDPLLEEPEEQLQPIGECGTCHVVVYSGEGFCGVCRGY